MVMEKKSTPVPLMRWRYSFCCFLLLFSSMTYSASAQIDLLGYGRDWPLPAASLGTSQCPEFTEFYGLGGEVSYIVDPKPPMARVNQVDLLGVFLRAKRHPALANRMMLKLDNGKLLVSFFDKDKVLSTELLTSNGKCINGWFIVSDNIRTNSEGAMRSAEQMIEIGKASDSSLIVRKHSKIRTSELIFFKTFNELFVWVRFRTEPR
jgi:hypothetical protein